MLLDLVLGGVGLTWMTVSPPFPADVGADEVDVGEAEGLGLGLTPQARPCRAEDVDPRTLVKEVLGICGPAGGDQEVAGVAAPGASETAEGRDVILKRGDGRPLTAPALG